MARNKLTAEEADRRIQAQMTNEQRVAFADRVIWNNGTSADLERAVRSSDRMLLCVLWEGEGPTAFAVRAGVMMDLRPPSHSTQPFIDRPGGGGVGRAGDGAPEQGGGQGTVAHACGPCRIHGVGVGVSDAWAVGR